MSDTDAGADAMLQFWWLATRLKGLRRTGWLDRGVREPESGADHSWGVATLAWLLARDRPDLDRERVLLLGLLHDLPEAVAGDPTPFDEARDAAGAIDPRHFSQAPVYSDAARDAKREAEEAALDTLLAGLPDPAAREIRDAWREYEAGETPEARFVRQVDKLETLIQAEAYLDDQPGLSIESFRLGTRRDVSDPRLVALLDALSDRSR